VQVPGGPGAQPHPTGGLHCAQPLRAEPLRAGRHVHSSGGPPFLQMPGGPCARSSPRGQMQ
jgi:hypothetical protein